MATKRKSGAGTFWLGVEAGDCPYVVISTQPMHANGDGIFQRASKTVPYVCFQESPDQVLEALGVALAEGEQRQFRLVEVKGK